MTLNYQTRQQMREQAEAERLAQLARPFLADLEEQDREYEEECAADLARNRRPHYCRHGVNQWVDYDPICGACEEGLTNEELARRFASTYMAEAKKLGEAYTTFKDLGINFPPKMLRQATRNIDIRFGHRKLREAALEASFKELETE